MGIFIFIYSDNMNNIMLYEEFYLIKPKPLDDRIIKLIKDIEDNFNIENLHANKKFEADGILTQTVEYIYKGQNIKIEKWKYISLHAGMSGTRFYINDHNLEKNVRKKYINKLWKFLVQKWNKKIEERKAGVIDKILTSSEEELTNKANDPYGEENWV
jgi:hypothetical protein